MRRRSSGSRIAFASSLLAPRNVTNRANPRANASANASIFAEGLILQPQAQDDERVGRPVEFAVESRDELVAPQNRQRVVAELALVLRACRPPTRSRSQIQLWRARAR